MNSLDGLPQITLPDYYIPQPHDILCGKTKESFNHGRFIQFDNKMSLSMPFLNTLFFITVGNRRFRITISLFLRQYNELRSRTARGALIASLSDMIHSNGGRFLKLRNKRWVTLTAKEARTKIGHALRDSNHQQQKSSTTPPPPESSDWKNDGCGETFWRAIKRQRTLFEPLPLPPTGADFAADKVGSANLIKRDLLTDPLRSSFATLDLLDMDWSSKTSSDVSDDDDDDDDDFLNLINKLHWEPRR